MIAAAWGETITKPVLEVFNWFQTAPGGETRKLSSYESSPNSVRNSELGVLGTARCGGPNAAVMEAPPPSRRPPNSFEPCGFACIIIVVVETLVVAVVFVDVLSGGDKVARKDRRILLALETVV